GCCNCKTRQSRLRVDLLEGAQMKTSNNEVASTSTLRRVVAASLIGSVIEWYEYLIYGTMAALVFNELFFPSFDPTVGIILAFATFAVGFISRPLGAVVYGHLGDRVGRKTSLVSTLIVMGTITTAMGLLPTYSQIGVFAPILLMILRFFQGVAVGGEWGGATLLTMEYAPEYRRGFFSSLPQIGVPAGTLLASGTIAIVEASMSEESFLTWGWRIPFLASAVLVIIGLIIRLKLEETPAFSAIAESGQKAKNPVMEVI